MTTSRNDASPNASQAQRTATSAYAAARNDIARLLDVLDMELAKHDERAKADEKNWGFAGSLKRSSPPPAQRPGRKPNNRRGFAAVE